MVRLFFPILMLFYVVTAVTSLQAQPPSRQATDSMIAFRCFFEPMPEFPGGPDSLNRFLYRHLRYPEYEQNEGIEGRVVVRLKILPDGAIDSAVVVRGVTADLDAEVLRLVGLMPRWIYRPQVPANYVVYYVLPIVIRLD